MKHKTKILLIAIAVLVIGLITVTYSPRVEQHPLTNADKIEGLIWPVEAPLRPFQLVDQYAEPFDLERLRGKWTLFGIGYTNCPDVCPLTLSQMKNIKSILSERAPKALTDTQFVFVSVDPKRDNSEQLRAFLQYFDTEFIGVTGDEKEIDILIEEIAAVYVKPKGDPAIYYSVGHSAGFHLVNPEGELVCLFTTPHQEEDIVARYIGIRQFMEGVSSLDSS